MFFAGQAADLAQAAVFEAEAGGVLQKCLCSVMMHIVIYKVICRGICGLD